MRLALQELPDCRIINLDELTYAGNPANRTDIESDPRYRFMQSDICNRELMEKLP